ncbi:hypothetical protein [Thauera sp. Sel9]|uniref:hypothetical protein n=1 Tax=Thauera sp. Sel9 TaxID=2974299 RepID=UPI0021E1A9FD|nr:hypothetical protein [Thauera sp. Sel9]MCV2218251.1 hypothetical protein [Thauera sp. Sel9]
MDNSPSPLVLACPSVDSSTLTFDIDTCTRRFTPYYRCDVPPLQPNIESAILLAALPAMQQGRRIDLGAPVSATLLRNLTTLSEIFSGWYPEYKPLVIQGPEVYSASAKNTGRVGSFFTGGVDSFHTFLKHQHEITDLIYVHGYDLDLDDHSRRHAISTMGRSVAEQAGIRFIEIESDGRELFRSFGHWGKHGHGFALGAAGRLLVGILDKIYIPSSFAQQDLMPWGSHPDTDPLFSDEALQFVHDGCEATRVQKIERISENPIALAHLRVCWERVEGAYNCGVCEKCLRTMTSLYALGALSDAKTFPEQIDTRKIRSILLKSDSQRKFAKENIQLMEQSGLQETPVYKAWKHILERSEFQNWAIWRFRRTRGKMQRALRKISSKTTSTH